MLSEFAGAAQSLGAGAILVNPWNITDMAAAIEDALTMSEQARRRPVFFICRPCHTANQLQGTWGSWSSRCCDGSERSLCGRGPDFSSLNCSLMAPLHVVIASRGARRSLCQPLVKVLRQSMSVGAGAERAAPPELPAHHGAHEPDVGGHLHHGAQRHACGGRAAHPPHPAAGTSVCLQAYRRPGCGRLLLPAHNSGTGSSRGACQNLASECLRGIFGQFQRLCCRPMVGASTRSRGHCSAVAPC